MGASSRAKGARGELEACEALARVGLDCVRTRQYANSAQGHKSPDVVCDRADIWFEVKRTEHLSPYRFMDQALIG
jgi:Holliday junction resolvase